MAIVVRTNASNPEFIDLVAALDKDLAIRDGEEHAFYAQYNKIAESFSVVVAYQDCMPVGCGAIKPYTTGIAEVKRMYVPPEMRKKGFATLVLGELEAWGRELGLSTLILETGLKQPEAMAFYKKNGYTIIPNFGQYIGVENSVCFQKHI